MQNFELSSESQVKSRKSPKSKKKVMRKRKTWLCLLYGHLSTTTTHPTINFSNTSRGPRRHCNTFLRSSQHPLLKSKRARTDQHRGDAVARIPFHPSLTTILQIPTQVLRVFFLAANSQAVEQRTDQHCTVARFPANLSSITRNPPSNKLFYTLLRRRRNGQDNRPSRCDFCTSETLFKREADTLR